MEWLYKLGVNAYVSVIHIVSAFNPKAKEWVTGRKNWRERLRALCKKLPEKRIWIHCASAGEYEQIIPVLQKIERAKEVSVVLTFFSPSGFEFHKHTKYADLVFYLPADNANNAKDFLDIVNPAVAAFIKYEFWYYYLKELHERSIDTFLVSAIFREDQFFFKPYGKWFITPLRWYKTIFVQNRLSYDLLASIGLSNVEVSGDTRIDRVCTLAEENRSFPQIESFKGDDRILIVGSSWETEDEWIIKLIDEGVLPHWKFIIAPHEIVESKLQKFESEISLIRYSQLDHRLNERVILCDGVGYLSRIYRYADVALIGGGFNGGVHSTLEPAAFGVPMFFGPDHKSFVEPSAFIELDAGFEAKSYTEFKTKLLELTSDEARLTRSQEHAKKYVFANGGDSELISNRLKAYLA